MGESIRKLLFATDLCHNCGFYVVFNAILTTEGIAKLIDYNLTTLGVHNNHYPARFHPRALKMAPRAARKSATPAPVEFGCM